MEIRIFTTKLIEVRSLLRLYAIDAYKLLISVINRGQSQRIVTMNFEIFPIPNCSFNR